ncbi:MAG: sigma-70 family RNA polymerase sigma factor [Anaerolineaceae bacterium]|nr:sigma-70 family RNA polymerase sigma factor [Anaerolineaceae bacterium]
MAGREKYEALALVHLDVVYRTAYALSGSDHEAEDLAQTTFTKALERFNTFAEGTNCRAWLLQILRNTWFDRLRHRKVTGPSVPLDEELAAEPEQPAEVKWSDARDLLENFSDEQIIEALKSLPDQQRLTLFLVEVEELSHEEAGLVMGVAVGTIKSRASRARAALKSKLRDHARELGMGGGGP